MPDGTRGAMLRAYDKKTGADAGAVAMPGAQNRIADDLHARRQAIPRCRVEQLDHPGPAGRLQAPMKRLAALGGRDAGRVGRLYALDEYGGVTITTFTHSDIQLEYQGKVVHIDHGASAICRRRSPPTWS
jgi:hypothetical protein